MRIEKQLTESDCAVWAIKALCFHKGVPVPPGNIIRQHIDLDEKGTTVRGVCNALDVFGIVPRAVQGPCDAIASAPLPAIAVVELSNKRLHYVVVLEADEHVVSYFDPASGGRPITISADEFAEMFTGNLVLCERKPKFAEIEFDAEPDSRKFFVSSWLQEANSIVAMAMGEVFQLLVLLLGILLLKSFFGSSLQGMPNFWFLSGMLLCGIIFVWISRQIQNVQCDIQSRTLLSLFELSNRLIRKSSSDPKGGLQAASSRCVNVVTAVANAVSSSAMIPGHTFSVILYVALLLWIDSYAALYAFIVAAVLPAIALWIGAKRRVAQREAFRAKDRNEIDLVYLLAGAEDRDEIASDLLWNQLGYCEALEDQRRKRSSESMLYDAIARLNVLAGLLIGGLQHSVLGLGHTVAVFFLMSVFTGVVVRWAKKVAAMPEYKHQIRSLLDFLSDFSVASIEWPNSSVQQTPVRSRIPLQDRNLGDVQ